MLIISGRADRLVV